MSALKTEEPVLQRIETLINTDFGGNRSAFARDTGLNYKTLTRTFERGTSPSFETLRSIVEKADIDGHWLLTGEGSMKNGTDVVREADVAYRAGRGVPYYDVDFLGGTDDIFNDQTIRPAHYFDFEPFNHADAWVNVTGHSMDDIICHGDMVALKELDDWQEFFPLGEIYAVVTKQHRMIKTVAKSDDPKCYRMIPYNTDSRYHEQDIPKHLILRMYQVVGSIKKFF